MSSEIEVRKKTVTKRDRSKSKGTARRKHVTINNRGKGNATIAKVGTKKK